MTTRSLTTASLRGLRPRCGNPTLFAGGGLRVANAMLLILEHRREARIDHR